MPVNHAFQEEAKSLIEGDWARVRVCVAPGRVSVRIMRVRVCACARAHAGSQGNDSVYLVKSLRL